MLIVESVYIPGISTCTHAVHQSLLLDICLSTLLTLNKIYSVRFSMKHPCCLPGARLGKGSIAAIVLSVRVLVLSVFPLFGFTNQLLAIHLWDLRR